MPREYRHISQYGKEIYELRKQGFNLNEMGKKLGFTHQQVRNFIHRENRGHRKIEARIALKRRGRPPKDSHYVFFQLSTLRIGRYFINFIYELVPATAIPFLVSCTMFIFPL